MQAGSCKHEYFAAPFCLLCFSCFRLWDNCIAAWCSWAWSKPVRSSTLRTLPTPSAIPFESLLLKSRGGEGEQAQPPPTPQFPGSELHPYTPLQPARTHSSVPALSASLLGAAAAQVMCTNIPSLTLSLSHVSSLKSYQPCFCCPSLAHLLPSWFGSSAPKQVGPNSRETGEGEQELVGAGLARAIFVLVAQLNAGLVRSKHQLHPPTLSKKRGPCSTLSPKEIGLPPLPGHHHDCQLCTMFCQPGALTGCIRATAGCEQACKDPTLTPNYLTPNIALCKLRCAPSAMLDITPPDKIAALGDKLLFKVSFKLGMNVGQPYCTRLCMCCSSMHN